MERFRLGHVGPDARPQLLVAFCPGEQLLADLTVYRGRLLHCALVEHLSLVLERELAHRVRIRTELIAVTLRVPSTPTGDISRHGLPAFEILIQVFRAVGKIRPGRDTDRGNVAVDKLDILGQLENRDVWTKS